jgi:PAS domain-containing protein
MGADGYVRKPFDISYVATLWEMARRERALLRVEDRLEERTRELCLSESRFRLLFDRMLNGFALHEIVYDEYGKPCDYRFLDANPAFEKIIGMEKEEILGKTSLEIFPGRSLAGLIFTEWLP